MKIVELNRTISGQNYDNLSARATLDESDDPVQKAVELDSTLQRALFTIEAKNERLRHKREEVYQAKSVLERALRQSENIDIPF